MMFLLYTVHVLISLFLVAVVLLQQGKGADLSVFGGGGTQTAFGARGAATVLHKLTVTSFVLFIVTTLTIGILQSRSSGSGVLGTLPEAETAAEETAEPTGALPTDEEDSEPAAAIGDEDVDGEESAGDDAPADDSAADDGAATDATGDDGAASGENS